MVPCQGAYVVSEVAQRSPPLITLERRPVSEYHAQRITPGALRPSLSIPHKRPDHTFWDRVKTAQVAVVGEQPSR